jgi:CBS domain-containing protein
MTSRVVTVQSDQPVAAAVDHMVRFGFSAIPVVSATTRLVGVVSLIDVLRCREEHDSEGVETDGRVRVEEIMTRAVVSIHATANASAVARRLRSHGELRLMPVVQGGRLVGVVTRSDLLRRRYPTGRPAGGLQRLLGRRRRSDDDLPTTLRPRGRAAAGLGGTTPVIEVMTREAVTIGPSEPVTLAAELILRHRHTALPVVDGGGRLVGIVSEADILADPLAGRSGHSTVRTVMTPTPITLEVRATVGEARKLFTAHGLRTVPVVDRGRLAGVVSRSDLV